MTSMKLARDAIRAYPRTDYSARSAVNHLRRQYIKARQALGDRWILAKKVAR